MNKLLTDFDGVLLRTEFAKSLEWFIASLAIQGKVYPCFTDRLARNETEALEQVKKVLDGHFDEFEKMKSISGMSRKDTRDAVWRLMNYSGTEYTSSDLERIRGRIKFPLESHYSERIEGNMGFFQEAKKRGLELGLITQAKEEEIRRLTSAKELCLDDIFQRIECIGDDFYKEMGKKNDPYAAYVDKKAVGYGCLCRLLEVNPWETITIEDSQSGVSAANSAGVVCIGYREEYNNQDLSKSALVIPCDLGCLVNDELMNALINKNPREFVLHVHDYLGRKGLQSELREDYKNA